MSEVLCDMTSCKYNSSCCQSPHESIKTYCTNKKINLIISEEIQCLECAQYEANYDKEIECKMCQIKKYGGIKLQKDNYDFICDN